MDLDDWSVELSLLWKGFCGTEGFLVIKYAYGDLKENKNKRRNDKTPREVHKIGLKGNRKASLRTRISSGKDRYWVKGHRAPPVGAGRDLQTD